MNYVKSTGCKTSSDTIIEYYNCNRTGYFTSVSSGKRLLKAQGSSKLNAYCTASLTVRKHDNGKISVEICNTHYSHTPSLGHLRLSKSQRSEIAKKLSEGVTVDRILDDVRDNISSNFNRSHLLTRKDILNIERAFLLRSTEKHTDDATSVAILIKELNEADKESPVLFYKQQGKCLNDHQFLDKHDFVLVLQTPYQSVMMKEFGHNVICIDSTFKTTGYDFTLITVLIIDEFGEGYPVAWCLTSREDQKVISLFLKTIKDRTGIVTPRWIMTDDADQFFNSWKTVFSEGPQKLLCTWHVDKAWRGALASKIADKQLQCQLYHSLTTIAEEPDINVFNQMLTNLEKQLQEHKDTKHFADYLHTYYTSRKEQWAMCYRKKAGINTNMHVESFHRLLKYIYMKGKVNKRVDKCIHILLKIARDKAYERLIKSEKGKISYRITCIRQRHKSSLEVSTDLVKENGNGCWKVASYSNPLICYEVCKEECSCSSACSLRCTECDICIHEYSCTCPDSLVRLTICKHIHLLLRIFRPNDIHNSKTPPSYIIKNDEVNKHDNILQEVKNSSKKRLGCAIDLNKNIDTLKLLVSQNSDSDMLNHINTLVCRAINLIQMTKPSSMDCNDKSPATKK